MSQAVETKEANGKSSVVETKEVNGKSPTRVTFSDTDLENSTAAWVITNSLVLVDLAYENSSFLLLLFLSKIFYTYIASFPGPVQLFTTYTLWNPVVLG